MPAPAPELPDDLLGEAFRRLPPDDPACLLRASLTCKRWRRILADPTFHRLHRERHRTPSVSGFLRIADYASHFVPNNPASGRPVARSLPAGWLVLDCRHGRALFVAPSPSISTKLNYDFVVWNPLTNQQRCLPRPSPPLTGEPGRHFKAAVLCSAAMEGCDHSTCHGGHFRVAFIWGHGLVNYARLFSSETDNWSEAISIQMPPRQQFLYSRMLLWRNSLVGDTLYFHYNFEYALEYQLGAHRLSIIQGPPRPVSPNSTFFVIPMGDGGLGCMNVEEDESSLRLQLWSREAASDSVQVARWTRGKAIDLKELLPNGALSSPRLAHGPRSWFQSVSLLGFAEGTDVIFVSTRARNHPGGVYMIQLNSGRATKVSAFDIAHIPYHMENVIPYTSFCIPVIDASSTSEGPGDNASGAFESQSACARASKSTITYASSTSKGPGDNASGA